MPVAGCLGLQRCQYSGKRSAMPPPLDVDKEDVRVLVVAVGPREAARQMGLKEATVNQWSARGGWLEHLRPENQPKAPVSMAPRTVTGVTNPASALQNTLLERRDKTKLGLSKWAARSSKHLSSLKGERAAASYAEAVGTAHVMSKLWPDQSGGSVRISMHAQQMAVAVQAEQLGQDTQAE